MSDYTSKISELNSLVTGNLAGEIPLSLTLSSGTLATNKIKLSQLRDLFDFDSAYSTVEEGIAATVENQMFYVYVDSNKLSVNEYVRTNIGANAVIGKSGTKKTIYIPALLKHVKVQVESFAALREFKPWWDGQVVYLKGYYSDGVTGGGDFVGHLGTKEDDGGVIAAGSGFYWERSVEKMLTPEMFGGESNINKDASENLQNTFNAAIKNNLEVVLLGIYVSQKALSVKTTGSFVLSGNLSKGSGIKFTNVDSYGVVIQQMSSTDFLKIYDVSFIADCQIINKKALLTIDATNQITSEISAGKYLLSDRTLRRGFIEKINISTTDNNYFVNGIEFKSLMNYSVSGVTIVGSRRNLTPLTNGVLLTGDGYPVDIHMTDFFIYNVGRAINSPDYLEGLHLTHCEFVNVLRGVSAAYDNNYSTISKSLCGFYGPYLSNIHVNLGGFTGADCCLYVENATTIQLSKMFLFASVGSDVINGYGIYISNSVGGYVSEIVVAGSGAANNKSNNNSFLLNLVSKMNFTSCRGTNTGSVFKVQGNSVNNIFSMNVGDGTKNVIYFDSENDQLNKVTASNRGIGLSDKVVGGNFIYNDLEPVFYTRDYTLTLGNAQAQNATLTFSIPIRAGTFGAVPDNVIISLPSTLLGIAYFNKVSSSASSINVTILFLAATPVGQYNLSITASQLPQNRTQ